ncbi:hypothetical protein ACE6H2_019625 [Prunus campanulata]
MDNVSRMEGLKLDSHSEVIDTDSGGNDLFSPAMIPLNTPTIGSQLEKSQPEESEDEESETEESDDEEIGECKYCLKVDDHYTQLCPYIYEVPENAIVGESCAVTCLVCGCLFRDSRCANCGISLGRARIKYCSICEKRGEHLPFECPKRDRNSGFTYNPYNGSFSVKIHPLKPVENAELNVL